MYFAWTPDGDLILDVEVADIDGVSLKRVTLTKERLTQMIPESPDGMRFLMNRAVGVLRKKVKVAPSNLKNLAKAPKAMNQILSRRFTAADDLLPPQLRTLEDQLIPVPTLYTVSFPIKV